MLANSVSPPKDGTSSAYSSVALTGFSWYDMSECQSPPKFIFVSFSLTIGITCGCPGNGSMKGSASFLSVAKGQSRRCYMSVRHALVHLSNQTNVAGALGSWSHDLPLVDGHTEQRTAKLAKHMLLASRRRRQALFHVGQRELLVLLAEPQESIALNLKRRIWL